MKLARYAFAMVLVAALSGVCRAGDADKPKYDMSTFKSIAEETLKLVKGGDYAGAQKKSLELEEKFDDGTKELKAADRKLWNVIDKQMDAAIDACKAAKDATGAGKAEKALNEFITKLSMAEKLK